MDVYINSEIGECSDFIGDDGRTRNVSIVISPLRVESSEDRLKIVSGCSMFQGCKNPECYFSSAARKKEKIKGRDS